MNPAPISHAKSMLNTLKGHADAGSEVPGDVIVLALQHFEKRIGRRDSELAK